MTTANEGFPCGLFDKPRLMRFDFNAIGDLEITTGKSIGQLLPSKGKEEEWLAISSIRAWIWAGLKWQDRAMTIPTAGELIEQYFADGGSNQAIMDCINGALAMCEFLKKLADPGGNGQGNFPIAEAKETKASP